MINSLNRLFKSKLAHNSMWLFVLQVFNTIVPLLTLPYITRVLGATNYGVFSLALNWVTYFQVIVEYGFGFTGARNVSINKGENIQPLYSRIISARILLLIASYVAMNLISFIANVDKEQYISMNILFLIIIGVAFQLTWLFQGMQDMKFITIVNAISRLISVILVFVLVRGRGHLYLYCFCYSATFLLSALIGLVFAKKKYGLKVELCRFRYALNEIKDGWYLFISQAMAKIISAVGTTVLGIVAISSVVGIYSAIYKLPQIMILFFSPISQALYPHISVKFSESFSSGSIAVKKAAKYVLPLFALGGIIIIIFRTFIIKVAFGKEYLEYELITIPLIIWMLLSVTNNFLGVQFLVASGNQKAYSQAVTIGAFITITLNIVLGFVFNVYGISLAATLGELFLTVVLIYKAKKVAQQNCVTDPEHI
jgi:PST family polysaccharide transporter